MLLNYRYEGDGIRRAFFIPFPYGGAADIACDLLANGVTRRLQFGVDYRLVENCVIYALPHGAALEIMLITPLAQAEALREARAQAAEAAGISEARSAWHAQAAAQVAEDAAAQAENTARIAQSSMTAIEAKAQSAVKGFEARANELASSSLAAMESSLASARTKAAKQLSDLAGDAKQSAARDLALARKQAQEVSATALSEIEAAEVKALAAMASPGIKAIAWEDMEAGPLAQGFYVLNENLPAATQSMGIFCVDAVEGIRWDGFFAIIPGCPGHDGASLRPPQGSGGLNSGENPWWLPCDHEH